MASTAWIAVIALAGCSAPATTGETTPATVAETTEATSAAPGTTAAATAPVETTEPAATVASTLPTEAPDGYSFAVVAPGGTYYVDVPAIEALPQITIDTPQAGMPQQTGAGVLDVLEAAGVVEFEQLVVTGPNGTDTFTADEIDGTVILGVSKRQTIRFSGEAIDKDRWVQDVTEIVVE